MSRRTSTIVIAGVVVLIGSPFAFSATRSNLREGVRNPTSGAATQETQIIASTGQDTYGTRQSNLGDGGAAIYGCRSSLDPQAIGDPKKSTPCVRANNLANGKAFDFQVKLSRIGGVIQIGPSLTTPKPDSAPFVTNGTGVAVGLNADRVDSLNGNEIVTQAANAAVAAINAGGGGGGGGGTGTVCPANTTLVAGGCLETAPRPALSFADAATACGAAGRRLVPPDVLLGARSLTGINLGGGEMSADITAATLALAQGYATVSDAGTLGVQSLGSATAFRCITG
jgi:hypothetical protein